MCGVLLYCSTIFGSISTHLAFLFSKNSLDKMLFKFVHRDIKPGIIMIAVHDSRAVLIDLGLSKRNNSNQTMTIRAVFLGTPGYMSPEMAEGHVQADELDARVDVWAVGVVLHEMLTASGERLFPLTEIMVAAYKIRNFTFQPLAIKEKVPGLNLILKNCWRLIV